MSGPSFSVLSHRGVIALAGEDRFAFLQGLISNDVTKVAPTKAIWAALLTPQGRFLNDMFVVDAGFGTLLLETERERAPALARKLALHKLRSKVTVEDRSAAMDVAVVFGPGAEKCNAVPGALSYVDPRLPALGVRVLVPAGQAGKMLGLPEAPASEYETLRLALGVPDGSRDLPVEKALLLENGFDELNGVDWHKGCYIGQELTARTKYRGLVKKRLFPVRIEGAAPEPGTVLSLDGREAGEMRSSRDGMGLALLRLDMVEALTRPNPTRLVAWTPQWMRLPE